jgi:hypothetical protein
MKIIDIILIVLFAVTLCWLIEEVVKFNYRYWDIPVSKSMQWKACWRPLVVWVSVMSMMGFRLRKWK